MFLTEITSISETAGLNFHVSEKKLMSQAAEWSFPVIRWWSAWTYHSYSEMVLKHNSANVYGGEAEKGEIDQRGLCVSRSRQPMWRWPRDVYIL